MRIDYMIMNPPYDKNLHLKFLERTLEDADKVVSVQPTTWITNPLVKYKKSTDFKRYANNVVNRIRDIEEFSITDGQELFNIKIKSNVGIITLDKNGGYVFEIKSELVKKLMSKINTTKRFSYRENNFSKEYKIILPTIHGHPGNLDWTEVTSKIYKIALNIKDSSPTNRYIKLSFDTENERLNFYNSLFTTFYKYLISELRPSNVTACFIEYLPFMEDYSKPWTNKRFCDYFGITGYISDTKAEPNSEWEEILNNVNKYRQK